MYEVVIGGWATQGIAEAVATAYRKGLGLPDNISVTVRESGEPVEDEETVEPDEDQEIDAPNVACINSLHWHTQATHASCLYQTR